MYEIHMKNHMTDITPFPKDNVVHMYFIKYLFE